MRKSPGGGLGLVKPRSFRALFETQEGVAAGLPSKPCPPSSPSTTVRRSIVSSGSRRAKTSSSWLDGLARGETSLQHLRRDAAAAPKDMHLRMRTRLVLSWMRKEGVLSSSRMDDTSTAARARYDELLRSQRPHERLAQAVALSRMVRQLATASIRRRYPNADENEMRARLAVRLYGRAVAARLFHDLPADAV
jgi:hypothetical protein